MKYIGKYMIPPTVFPLSHNTVTTLTGDLSFVYHFLFTSLKSVVAYFSITFIMYQIIVAKWLHHGKPEHIFALGLTTHWIMFYIKLPW